MHPCCDWSPHSRQSASVGPRGRWRSESTFSAAHSCPPDSHASASGTRWSMSNSGRRSHDRCVIRREPRAVCQLFLGKHMVSRRLACAVQPSGEDSIASVAATALCFNAQPLEEADDAATPLEIGRLGFRVANGRLGKYRSFGECCLREFRSVYLGISASRRLFSGRRWRGSLTGVSPRNLKLGIVGGRRWRRGASHACVIAR